MYVFVDEWLPCMWIQNCFYKISIVTHGYIAIEIWYKYNNETDKGYILHLLRGMGVKKENLDLCK